MAGQTYFLFKYDLNMHLCGPKKSIKENAMKLSSCIPQKISKFTLGIILVAAALAMTVVSFTLLPVIGLVLVVPIVILAIYVFRLHLNDQCEIDFSESEDS
jgi:Flp pilus assembly protein TadB